MSSGSQIRGYLVDGGHVGLSMRAFDQYLKERLARRFAFVSLSRFTVGALAHF
jgi:hypothetical protein